MALSNLILPKDYTSKLDIIETEIAIKLAKDTFERELASALSLTPPCSYSRRPASTTTSTEWSGQCNSMWQTSMPTFKLSIPLPNGSAWRSPATGSVPIPASIRI